MDDRHHRMVERNWPMIPALAKGGMPYERAVARLPAWRNGGDERRLRPRYRAGVECGRAYGPCRYDDRHLSGPHEFPGTAGRSYERGQRLPGHPLRPGPGRHIALESAP